ncbi:MAG: phosphoribosylamine--glycine ligase [Bacteroidetes bacterium]|nr:phosphoribosylamine--glycine ligase [Bacteroidota bacterium]MCW5897248.1 phosphoribosylamine--glycine ligase [Bacteroidota bacterium]
MKILVIGSGAREHALVWKIRQSPKVREIFCSPGNPGIGELAECLPMRATALEGLLDFAKRQQIDLTVVGPEQPLADGIVDLFEANGMKAFGPTKRAAELEWSKAFAKEFMERHGIPTARYKKFTASQSAEANDYLSRTTMPVVLKADGLAAGKGVLICSSHEQALASFEEMKRQFGSAGDTIVVEEFLEGEEASVFAICDGKDFVTLAPAQDHKRVFDGDRGKNTGGMGAYAPAPIVTPDILRDVEERIIKPTLAGMASEGRPYKGCLYVGLMITASGPRVIEYNCRFGDPETQVVLPLFNGDLVELFEATCEGRIETLRKDSLSAAYAQSAVCVVLASVGYPDEYPTGIEIDGLDELTGVNNVLVFHAGTKSQGGTLVTAGGRVLGVTALKSDLAGAIEDAYNAVGKISFAGAHYRRDIGKKAFVH